MKYLKKYLLNQENQPSINKKALILNTVLALALILGILYFSFSKLEYTYRWNDTVIKYKKKFFIGFMLTVYLSCFSLILSLVIGSITVIFRKSKIILLGYLSRIYVELIRGTPLIVQIYIFFYVIGTAFNLENRYVMGILIMGIFSGAYVAEIIRSGIESIEVNQFETAKSLGFTKVQTYRYIILPQVIKRIMPPLAGQFGSLIKDSSLLSIIAVNELTKNVQEVDSLTFAPLENYLFLAIGYIILTYPISYFSKKLERRFAYDS
ncbi:amino acid ABC transporter permease [Cetobacterium sp. 2A]|uniref:amino acid ABC transporter permease n=1 Tax=unclassified Cetobacterium TaxID=2630983 RepID=UPI00163B745A|nr:amino acid ABC transporter permease [Cetobacterium sp. 2A]MBC2854993.1 amino acid ABC transporter permease [Cetobacterium sp. 2A]